MEKKKWVQPELIVLVRSKPEESVLNGCKYWTESSGPDYWFDACRYGDPNCYDLCSSAAES